MMKSHFSCRKETLKNNPFFEMKPENTRRGPLQLPVIQPPYSFPVFKFAVFLLCRREGKKCVPVKKYANWRMGIGSRNECLKG